MSNIRGMLQDELERLERMKEAYLKKIRGLPKGVIIEKKINNGSYFYIQRRENSKKVVSIYLKRDRLEQVSKQIKERQSHEMSLKSIKEDINFIQRALKLKVKNGR